MSLEESCMRYREKNNKSARNEAAYVLEEVDRLVKAGQVVEVKTAPRCTNPLSVAFKINTDGTIKKRLVIDLSRWVNKFVIPNRFRMTQFKDVLEQSVKGDYQSVYGISKAYHHIRLHPDSYELVGFCVEDLEGVEHYYHYVVVVFGLGPAGQALGRLMRPLLRYLTLQGIRNLVYVDDGHVAAALKANVDRDYATTLKTFKLAGFLVAKEKSDAPGCSAQRKEYLGFVIDTDTLSVEVPKQKMDRIKQILTEFFKSPRHKVRTVASVLGKLISLEPALGKSVLVGTRLATIAVVVATEVTEMSKRKRNPWERTITLDLETMEAMADVSSQLDSWKGFPVRAWHTGISLS
jgi:hypothetical protein